MSLQAVHLIAKKRDGQSLRREEIAFFIRQYTAGEIPDYQMSAMLMAIYLRGMTVDETVWLTEEMLHSGAVCDYSDLGKRSVDKHSTGGVGDKTSLIIAPVVAAAGALVPMISGRALAHSGGTLDKLESIPGFRVDLSLDEVRKQLGEIGAVLYGQTQEIAPADKKLYALRDVTATVSCPPLICASIMSKKMAEGIDGLVLDVKVGEGAFIKSEGEAWKLARTLIEVAHSMKKECVALMTDMNQPLGRMTGNSLEIREVIEVLKGGGPPDLVELCRQLAAQMLVLGHVSPDEKDGAALYDRLIDSGAALEKLREIIRAQGGNDRVLDEPGLLPAASSTSSVRASEPGYLQSIDTEAVGWVAMQLGAGRSRLDSPIDQGVGLEIIARIGDQVSAGDELAIIHFNDSARAEEARAAITRAFRLGPVRAEAPPLIHDVIY